jgi:nucleoside-diphosphate-sugar epimerase
MKHKEKILITGAGGFLGSYITRELLKNNFYQVHSFSRSRYSTLESLGIIQHVGDLENFDNIKEALIGIDAVIHCASKVGMNGRYQDFFKANVLGTENLIKAMKETGINKLVYTSTPSVVFGKDDLIDADETTPYPENFLTAYAETKMLAEKKVLEANDKNFWSVSLRPHLVFGPGDLNLIPRLLISRKKNQLKIIGDGKNKVDVIYVENAAKAHVQALGKLESNPQIRGQAYFIGQGPVVLWDFINLILKHNGLPAVEKKVPLAIAYFIGTMIEFFLFITGKHDVHPPMSRYIALQLGKSHYFSHAKAERDLDFRPTISIAEAIAKLN